MTHTISICMGSSCFARGNEENLEIIESLIAQYGLECRIELVGQRCTGNCSDGPVIHIDDKIFKRVTASMIKDMIRSLLPEDETFPG